MDSQLQEALRVLIDRAFARNSVLVVEGATAASFGVPTLVYNAADGQRAIPWAVIWALIQFVLQLFGIDLPEIPFPF